MPTESKEVGSLLLDVKGELSCIGVEDSEATRIVIFSLDHIHTRRPKVVGSRLD